MRTRAADAAASFGTTIAQTEAWRQSTHGIQQLFDGLNTLEGGIFKADAVPEIRRQSAGTAVIDGQRCMVHSHQVSDRLHEHVRHALLQADDIRRGAAYAELRQRVADASARAARAEQEAGQLRAAAGGAHEEVAEEAQRRAAEWLAYELGRSGKPTSSGARRVAATLAAGDSVILDCHRLSLLSLAERSGTLDPS